MPVLIGVAILLVLLWAARRSRARGILNIAQQRFSGAVAILIATRLLVRGDWGLGLGLGLFGTYLLGQALPWLQLNWQVILTAQEPAGVSTCRLMRTRVCARGRRPAAK
jgi:hypothetical protein